MDGAGVQRSDHTAALETRCSYIWREGVPRGGNVRWATKPPLRGRSDLGLRNGPGPGRWAGAKAGKVHKAPSP